MAHYNLMDPAELAELGYFSSDPLTQNLGLSLGHYIEESEFLHKRHKELSDRVNDLTRTVDELEARNAELAIVIKKLAEL